jgi:hypothetical protein
MNAGVYLWKYTQILIGMIIFCHALCLVMANHFLKNLVVNINHAFAGKRKVMRSAAVLG